MKYVGVKHSTRRGGGGGDSTRPLLIVLRTSANLIELGIVQWQLVIFSLLILAIILTTENATRFQQPIKLGAMFDDYFLHIGCI